MPEFSEELDWHLAVLFAFARKINELDVAAALGCEFRGAQDPGWATTITAKQVFDELFSVLEGSRPFPIGTVRVVLFLYCQLAEAGGFYEGLKNVLQVVQGGSYSMWPFRDLVRVSKFREKVIGPNANAVFRDLAKSAQSAGMLRLSELIGSAFRDDIRNAISHADYVIWSDGLRIRNRNGGYATRVSFEELTADLNRAIAFVDCYRQHIDATVLSFDPPREIVGRLSMNMPMAWTVAYNRDQGSFSLSSSSPGIVRSKESEKQETINKLLNGKVFQVFSANAVCASDARVSALSTLGFETAPLHLSAPRWEKLQAQIQQEETWDRRVPKREDGDLLILTPWGFRAIFDATEIGPLFAFGGEYDEG